MCVHSGNSGFIIYQLSACSKNRSLKCDQLDMRKYVYLYMCMCAFWFYNIRENNSMVSTAWTQTYMFQSSISVHVFAEICISICVCAFREFWFYNILAEGLFQEQEFKMWSIGYAEMCLSICLYAFWEFWFYNIRENDRMIRTARIQTYMSQSHIPVYLCVRASVYVCVCVCVYVYVCMCVRVCLFACMYVRLSQTQ